MEHHHMQDFPVEYRAGPPLEEVQVKARRWFEEVKAHLPEPHRSAIRRTIEGMAARADVVFLRVYAADALAEVRRQQQEQTGHAYVSTGQATSEAIAHQPAELELLAASAGSGGSRREDPAPTAASPEATPSQMATLSARPASMRHASLHRLTP